MISEPKHEEKVSYTTWSLFEEPYWLDSVAPGAWDAVEVRNGNEVVGRLPFVCKKKFKLTSISSPRFTPWLGPWIMPNNTKYTKSLSTQHKILSQLISGLPSSAHYEIICAPEFSNGMAFHWAGFELGLAYTYRFPNVSDQDRLWSEFDGSTRNVYRKARKQLEVSTEPNLNALVSCLEKTYKRQGLDVTQYLDALERIDDVMGRRNQRRIYTAYDAQGRVHASNYIVFDKRHMFTLAGGGDPEFRNSGADTLLTFESIKDCRETAKVFDCAGSMLPHVEPFVRGFGGVQTPKIIARKTTAALKLVRNLMSLRPSK